MNILRVDPTEYVMAIDFIMKRNGRVAKTREHAQKTLDELIEFLRDKEGGHEIHTLGYEVSRDDFGNVSIRVSPALGSWHFDHKPWPFT